MKTFITKSWTNYGEVVHIVNAENEDLAGTLAEEHGAWDGYEIEELDTTKEGLVGIYGGDGG
jgi:hypothetical protein